MGPGLRSWPRPRALRARGGRGCGAPAASWLVEGPGRERGSSGAAGACGLGARAAAARARLLWLSSPEQRPRPPSLLYSPMSGHLRGVRRPGRPRDSQALFILELTGQLGKLTLLSRFAVLAPVPCLTCGAAGPGSRGLGDEVARSSAEGRRGARSVRMRMWFLGQSSPGEQGDTARRPLGLVGRLLCKP